uniref:Uncharacterized protein n=1 Tax=Arundo donax TaxID=35708 RepID=A0A0A9E4N2_ARUDO
MLRMACATPHAAAVGSVLRFHLTKLVVACRWFFIFDMLRLQVQLFLKMIDCCDFQSTN